MSVECFNCWTVIWKAILQEKFLRPMPDVFLSQDPATLRGPDVSFLRAERARLIDPKASAFQGAPDLAIEVVSPSDSARDLQRKVTQYMAAGAHAVWIVYPDSREVHAFTADGAVHRLCGQNILDAPDLLPGFSTPVAHLFD